MAHTDEIFMPNISATSGKGLITNVAHYLLPVISVITLEFRTQTH